MRNRGLFTLSLILFICVSVTAQINPDSTQIDYYKTKDFECVIFPKNYITLIGAKRFTPSRNEVNKAEKVLKKDLKGLNNPLINQGDKYNPIIHKKLRKYNR